MIVPSCREVRRTEAWSSRPSHSLTAPSGIEYDYRETHQMSTLGGFTMAGRAESVQALEEVIRRIGRRYRQRIGGDSVTFGQFAILRILAQEGPMAMGELAHNLGVSLAGCTGLIDRLVHADLVKRYRSDADRRVVWVNLTERGAAEFERLREERTKYFERVFASLDGNRIQQLLDILELVDRGLENEAKDAAPTTT